MTTTQAWIPLASAGAALIGGGVGAALQGKFGVSSWRRQARLEAYAKFIDAGHDFNRDVIGALRDGHPDAPEERWRKVFQSEAMLSRACSPVVIAGPVHIDKAARDVLRRARVIMEDLRGAEGFNRTFEQFRTPGGYRHLDAWAESADSFASKARKVLKTED